MLSSLACSFNWSRTCSARSSRKRTSECGEEGECVYEFKGIPAAWLRKADTPRLYFPLHLAAILILKTFYCSDWQSTLISYYRNFSAYAHKSPSDGFLTTLLEVIPNTCTIALIAVFHANFGTKRRMFWTLPSP